MKRSSWIYFLSFFCGILVMNMMSRNNFLVEDSLSVYTVSKMTWGNFSNERYFCHVLCLRMKICIFLYLCTKAFPAKAVSGVAGYVLAFLTGAMLALAVLSNGIYGIWIVLVAMFPQWIFYLSAFTLWKKRTGITGENRYYFETHKQMIKNLSGGALTMMLLMIILIGIVLESYFSPFLVRKVINM